MKNKEKEIKSLGTKFEVLEEGPKPVAAAQAAAPRPGGAPQPLRKAVATGSIGLMIALAGMAMPYGAAEYAFLPALAAAVILWQLLSSGMARTQATTLPLKPFGAILALATGGVALGLGAGGVTGAVLCILGGVLSLAAPGMGKKADSKLPPAPADLPVDQQFSKSLLAYLLIIFGLSLAWTNDPSATGLNTILGGLTFMFCLLGLWASWVGMWKMWAMPAFTTGSLGLVLFLAPLEAVFTGILGLSRVFMGSSMEQLGVLGAWPGDDAPGIMYAFGPLMVLAGGAFATFELVQGAKQGMKSNQVKKDAEIASRKAARAGRRGEEPEKTGAKDAKSSEKTDDKKDA
ncbi:MAG: hypothetical protein O3A95_01380 [Planctomycetota bacterium]|nr:hypothetical protein [Planctomycetota bacterium]MDA1112936.1 hypothetical protein [Planctomycetota bacterium]